MRRLRNPEQIRLQQLQQQLADNPLAAERVRRETAALLPTELERKQARARQRYVNIQRNAGRRFY